MRDEPNDSVATPAEAAASGERILEELKPLIREVTGARLEDIRTESILVEDLGAESIDLLDLSFLIEEHFGVTIQADEFEQEARERIGSGEYDEDGVLTDAALAQLKEALPEVDAARLAPGLRKTEVPALLPVSVFSRIIERKLTSPTADGETGGLAS